MADYGNRRKEARKPIVNFTLVHDAKSGKLLGYLRDLTLNGAQINGSRSLNIGTEVVLSIKLLSDIPEVMAKELRIDAKVQRCVTVGKEPASYEIGFEFIDLPSEEKDLIEKFLKRYQFSR